MPNINVKLSQEAKSQIKKAIRNPIGWWRGANLPEEELRPWEGGIQFMAEMLKGFMNGFVSMRNRLFIGVEEGKIRPNLMSIHDVIRITWDGLSDPPIGMFMDRRKYGEKILRWVMRFNATLSPIFIMIQCFDMGITPMQRVVKWTVIAMLHSLMSTANVVSETKIWAGITPHSEQRGALQLWRTIGDNVGALVTGIPIIMMGLAGTFGWDLSDYHIMVVGAALTAPITIFSRWLPSFAKQRVDFTVQLEGEGEKEKSREEQMTFREQFAIVKHNKWFMMWIVVDMIRILVPGTDRMLIYRFLVPSKPVFGREIDGLLIKTIFRDIVFGWPALALLPYAKRAVDWFGGDPIRFIKAHVILNGASQAISFVTGYQSWPRLAIVWTLEMMREVMGRWSSVPHTMIRFEMFDYVEWKTGHRSEGITESVNGLLRKLLRDNAGAVIGNLVMDWTGYKGWDIPIEEQPQRFMNVLWPLLHAGPVFGEIIALIFLMRFKRPHDPNEVERDLIERRALAQQMMEDASLAE